MTQLLQTAFNRIDALPEEQQDEIARSLIEELDDEANWLATVERTKDKLGKLEEKMREEIRSGRHDDADW